MGTEKRARQKANRAQRQVEVQKAAQRRNITKKVIIGVAVVAALFALLLVIALGFGDDDNDSPTTTTTAVPTVSSEAPTESVPGGEPTASEPASTLDG